MLVILESTKERGKKRKEKRDRNAKMIKLCQCIGSNQVHLDNKTNKTVLLQ